MLKTFLSQEKISKIRQTFKTIFENGKDIKKEPSMPKEQLRLFISKAAQNKQEVILQLNWTDGEIEEVSGTITLLHSHTDAILLKNKADHSLGYPIRIEQINYLSLKKTRTVLKHVTKSKSNQMQRVFLTNCPKTKTAMQTCMTEVISIIFSNY